MIAGEGAERQQATDGLKRGLLDGSAAAALEAANLPTMLSVLYQLTGDARWLAEPYRPTRTRGLEDHDTGGLAESVQEQVRSALLAALEDWVAGKPVAKPGPTGDELVRMMSVNVGEPVSPDFEPMMAEELGFRVRPQRTLTSPADDQFEVLVIGAGVSGMAMGVQLKKAGVPFRILEKNSEVGGTWLENRYPGCGVDTPSYLYSFSYQPRAWTTHFGKRDEVEKYMTEFADLNGLREHIEFGVEVLSAQWDSDAAAWALRLRRGDNIQDTTAAVVVTAVGQLNRPKVPDVPGLEQFGGAAFHSAQWPDDLDVTGKKVVVVGSGASAMQIVPAIVDQVAELTIFQRSPQWVGPNDNYFRAVSPAVHWLIENVPFYQRWYRFRLAWNFNDKVHPTLRVDPEWSDPRSINKANDGHRRHLTAYIERQLEGRDDLLAKALPQYPPFGKRMLLDNGWYAALREPHVRLVTDPVLRVDESGVTSSSGELCDADVIVFATGFEAQRLLHPLEIRGVDSTIREVWGDDDPRAYLGMATPGFPNMFFLYGPNTNLGHGGSWITMAECQARYVVDLLCAAIEGGIGSLECKTEVFDGYNTALDETHDQMVWTHHGMNSWYRNAAGRVVTNWPWRVADYWSMTETANLDDFICR